MAKYEVYLDVTTTVKVYVDAFDEGDAQDEAKYMFDNMSVNAKAALVSAGVDFDYKIDKDTIEAYEISEEST